jgi:hypothetical protein
VKIRGHHAEKILRFGALKTTRPEGTIETSLKVTASDKQFARNG